MKGITPVIAIILLLLITISMVGFAFVWFTNIQQATQERIGNATIRDIERREQKIRIVDRTTTTVTVRNVGSISIPHSDLTVLTDGVVRACPWSGANPLAINAVTSCTFAPACNSPSRITVDAPAGPDIITCP